ncbi:MAG: hypothetical protein O3A20_05820 [Planctomycetota bacterium]|nr:hypothetical protein [Planctomycetota bacterium]
MRTRTLLPLAAAALVAPLLSSAFSGPSLGAALPEFDAAKWYNTVPISVADLKDKTVLIEVFRTW